MFRLMVQGDRDARGIADQVRRLGELCKERGVGLNVGESGEIIRILCGTGANVRIHKAKLELPNLSGDCENVTVVDCIGPGIAAGKYLDERHDFVVNRLEWAVRLMCMISSSTTDGFIFFPGAEGTLAHLIPVMAFIAKGERDKGKETRRVALVGWPTVKVMHLRQLFGIGMDPKDDWLESFARTHPMEGILNFVTKADV